MVISFLILALVFFVISLIFISVLTFMFVKKHKFTTKENELKKEVNKLLDYDFEKANIPVIHISLASKKNQQIANVKDMFNKFASVYESKIKEIKKQILIIPKIIENYDWNNLNLIYKQTKHQINVLKNKINQYFDVYHNLIAYKNYVGYLIVGSRENSWNLINFYIKNIGIESKLINNKIKNLKHYVSELNKCDEIYEINHVINCLHKCYETFNDLLKITNENYIVKKQNNYIIYSVSEIKNMISKNFLKIKNSTINNAQKELAKVLKNKDYLINNSNNLSENEIHDITLNIIKKLIKIKGNLNITYKSNKFFEQNKIDVDNVFSNTIKLVPLIAKSIEKIFQNFIDDLTIKNSLISCSKLFYSIKKMLDNYLLISAKPNYDANNLLEIAKKIIIEVVKAIELTDKIILDVDRKYENYQKILNDITANKLILVQMKAFVVTNNLDLKNLDSITHLNLELNKVEADFFEKNFTNLEYNFATLNDIKSAIFAIKIELLKHEKIKNYIEKIINYICLKTVNEDFKIYKINKPIELYKEGNYNESIKLLVSLFKNKNIFIS